MRPNPIFLVRAASLLVPASKRFEWRQEWESEIRHACESIAQRGESPVRARRLLLRFAWGSFRDAAWYRTNSFDREDLARAFRRRSESPAFCFGAIAVVILLIVAASGLLPVTRAVLLPLPYASPDRIATVSQHGMTLSVRSGVRADWVRLWRAKSRLLEGVATYSWKESAVETAGHSSAVLSARVSENFFSLLGVHASVGRLFDPADAGRCADCVVVSSGFPVGPAHAILLDGRPRRVIGVLDRHFWFLSRRIQVWSVGAPSARSGAVVRLLPEVSRAAVEMELASIVQDSGVSAWDSLVEVASLQDRVRFVFDSYALALGLAMIVTAVSMRLRLADLNPRHLAFFCLKTVLLLMVVLLCGLEFTPAPSITMLGGTDLVTEPLSTWLFLLGSMGALSWSIRDQRRRCRACLRRLGLKAHVGCFGRLLLDWAGTELVCIEGHGMLYIPEMASSWQEKERWTALDDSWFDLFARSAE